MVRAATATDLPQAAALLAERGEPADAVDVELVATSLGLDGVGVVVDRDRSGVPPRRWSRSCSGS